MSELFDAATANEFSTELRSIQSSYASAKKTLNTLDGEVSDLHRDVDAVEGELLSLGRKSGAPLSVPNGLAVSEGCARHLGAIVLLSAERGKCLIVSACSGHGYKFGAAVGRRVAAAIGDGDIGALKTWLRAEV